MDGMKRLAVTVLLLALLGVAACGDDDATTLKTAEIPSWAKVAPEQIAEAKKHGVPVAFENDLGMRFVLIPAGTFLMGSPEDEEGRSDDETQHEVTLTKPFYMSIYETTNGQWMKFSQHLPSLPEYAGDSRPVNYISLVTAKPFVMWLRAQDPERAYTLPSEAQWEFACRAGTSTPFSTGSTLSQAQANFGDRNGTTSSVGSFPLNAWGLYDMHGNVLEWCKSRYGAYAEGEVTDPMGPSSGDMAVQRGGSWVHGMNAVRSAARHQDSPIDEYHLAGIRLVVPIP
jgi:sulfatase modifying factor 1